MLSTRGGRSNGNYQIRGDALSRAPLLTAWGNPAVCRWLSFSITEANVVHSALAYHSVWFVLVTSDKHLYTGGVASVRSGLTTDDFAVNHYEVTFLV